MRIWVAAGGTGGHLFPALAVVEEMERRLPTVDVKFAISRRGLEEKVLSREDRSYTTLAVEGFHRREVARNLLFPVNAFTGLFQSLREIVRFRPNVAFGTGGFVSGPALLAARLAGVPVALLALDAMPGATIRILAPLAGRVFIAHEEARGALRRRKNVVFSGTPSRPIDRVDRADARAMLGLPSGGFCLFVTGGSQGSRALNDVVSDALGNVLALPGLSILWQTGSREYDEISSRVDGFMENEPENVDRRVVVRAFIEEMNTAWSAADLALCRSGASTLAELSSHGIASLLVPLPTSAAGHQEANARALSEAGAAALITEDRLSVEVLITEITRLAEAPGELEAMSAAASGFSRGDATLRIAGGLVEMARDIPDEDRERMTAMFAGTGS